MRNNTVNALAKITEVELIYRSKRRVSERPVVSNSKEAHEVFRANWSESKIELQEQFKVMLLNASTICLGIATVGIGGLTSCVADPRHIFALALKANATSIIVAHNHPSGCLTPSWQDKDLTKKLHEGGKLLDIRLLDHILLTKNSFLSFADEGLMP